VLSETHESLEKKRRKSASRDMILFLSDAASLTAKTFLPLGQAAFRQAVFGGMTLDSRRDVGITFCIGPLVHCILPYIVLPFTIGRHWHSFSVSSPLILFERRYVIAYRLPALSQYERWLIRRTLQL